MLSVACLLFCVATKMTLVIEGGPHVFMARRHFVIRISGGLPSLDGCPLAWLLPLLNPYPKINVSASGYVSAYGSSNVRSPK